MAYKEKAELMALRRRVKAQREEIRRLQAERDSITVRQLLMTTTEKIVLRDDAGNMDTLEKRGPGRMIVNFDYLPLHVVRVRIGVPFPDDGKPFLLLETEEALP